MPRALRFFKLAFMRTNFNIFTILVAKSSKQSLTRTIGLPLTNVSLQMSQVRYRSFLYRSGKTTNVRHWNVEAMQILEPEAGVIFDFVSQHF